MRAAAISALLAFAAACSPRAPDASAAGTLLVGGSTALESAIGDAARRVTELNGFTVETSGGGSEIGLATARNGGVGTLSRKLTPAERASGLVAETVGADAIALIVHRDNPVRSLSREHVAAAFSGRIRMWRDLGGGGDSIALYGMGLQFGTHQEFVRLLGLEGVMAGGFQGYPWPEKILRLVAENPNGLAFLPLGNLLDLDPTLARVRLLAVDGATPLETDAGRDRYPLIRPLELVTLGPPKGAAKKFIDFMVSKDGQALLAARHFSKLHDAIRADASPASAPPAEDH